MPQVANTIAFRLGPFACLQRGTEGRLPPSTEKAIPSVPSMFDHHPTPAAPGDRRDRSDRSSHRHVKGVRTTGRLIRKAPCPVKGEGGEGGAEGGRGREREREGQGRTHWGRRGWGEAVGAGGDQREELRPWHMMFSRRPRGPGFHVIWAENTGCA